MCTRITEIIDLTGASKLSTFAALAVSVLFFEHILLGTFSLLLMPPLDRGTGVPLLMSERTALRFLDFIRQPGFQMAGMIAASRCSTSCLIRSSSLR